MLCHFQPTGCRVRHPTFPFPHLWANEESVEIIPLPWQIKREEQTGRPAHVWSVRLVPDLYLPALPVTWMIPRLFPSPLDLHLCDLALKLSDTPPAPSPLPLPLPSLPQWTHRRASSRHKSLCVYCSLHRDAVPSPGPRGPCASTQGGPAWGSSLKWDCTSSALLTGPSLKLLFICLPPAHPTRQGAQ